MINQRDENGWRHGLWEDYYDNGKLAWRGVYKNRNRHGLWEHYYDDNGKLGWKGEFKNDRERGLWYEQRYTK